LSSPIAGTFFRRGRHHPSHPAQLSAADHFQHDGTGSLVEILGQVSHVDRSAGVSQADPGGNNGTVSALSSEISFTATQEIARCRPGGQINRFA
jgi:hypothetical protein